MVAQKAADLGAAIALFWFIFKLVSVVDFHLKKWAASTDSSIDDILAPLFGKTLRVFIVIIGGIRRIGRVTSKLVPFMAALYVGAGTVVLLRYFTDIPAMLWTIVHSAFEPAAQVGGFAGGGGRPGY